MKVKFLYPGNPSLSPSLALTSSHPPSPRAPVSFFERRNKNAKINLAFQTFAHSLKATGRKNFGKFGRGEAKFDISARICKYLPWERDFLARKETFEYQVSLSFIVKN